MRSVALSTPLMPSASPCSKYFLVELLNLTNQLFVLLYRTPEVVFSKIEISDEHKEVLLATLARKLTVNPFKIRVDFSLTCTVYDGVEAIREALLTAKHEVNDETW